MRLPVHSCTRLSRVLSEAETDGTDGLMVSMVNSSEIVEITDMQRDRGTIR